MKEKAHVVKEHVYGRGCSRAVILKSISKLTTAIPSTNSKRPQATATQLKSPVRQSALFSSMPFACKILAKLTCFSKTYTKKAIIKAELNMNVHVARLVSVQSGPVNPKKMLQVQVPRSPPLSGATQSSASPHNSPVVGSHASHVPPRACLPWGGKRI